MATQKLDGQEDFGKICKLPSVKVGFRITNLRNISSYFEFIQKQNQNYMLPPSKLLYNIEKQKKNQI